MLRRIGLSIATAAFSMCLMPLMAEAQELTFRHTHHIFTVPSSVVASWRSEQEQWTYDGVPVTPPAALRVDGDAVPPLPPGFAKTAAQTWDRGLIAASLLERIVLPFSRDPSSVTIRRTATGGIMFEGNGLPGRRIALEELVTLTREALEQGVTTVILPVEEVQPSITVADDELRRLGIRELVTVGESDFSGSTNTRIHNVRVGLERFSGHLIEQGEVFSFVEVLGPVDASTGYLRELVIKGDRTVPDYGGGLCQVSSTAYRGIWEYGFPITQRKNHSYTVSYYAPQGTDATIYPPYVDMKFRNDSPGALLIQTVMDLPHKKAYFLYYGTKDDRTAEVVGPYVWDRVGPPPQRIEYTADLPPGQRKKLGEAVPGMKTAWFRIVQRGDEEVIEPTYSHYQARPLFYQVGIDPNAQSGSGEVIDGGLPAADAI